MLRVGQADPLGRQPCDIPTARLQELEEKAAELNAEEEHFQQQRDRWESEQSERQRAIAQQLAELGLRQTELATRQAEIGAQRAELATRQMELDARHEELTARQAELDGRSAEFDAQQAAFHTLEQAEQQRQAEREQSQERLDQRAAELDARAAELTAQCAAFQRQQREWEALQAQSQAELSRRAEELDAIASDLQSQPAAFEQRRQQWQPPEIGAALGLQEPVSASGCEADADLQQDVRDSQKGAPVDAAAILRKLGTEHALWEEEPEGAGQAAGESNSLTSGFSPPSSAVDAKGDDEEESIQQYMAQLMERIGATNRGSESSVPGVQSTPPQASAAPAASCDVADGGLQASQSMAPLHRKPIDMAPRTVAPEKLLGLSAMRELAKRSAQGAIDKHARQKTIRAQHTKLLMALGGMLASGVLLWMWSAWGLEDSVVYTGLLAFMVTVIWSIEYALLSGRLLINKKGHFDWKATERNEEPVAEQNEEAALPRSTSAQEDEALRVGDEAAYNR